MSTRQIDGKNENQKLPFIPYESELDLEIACYPNTHDNYISKVATTEQEIFRCIESGF